MKRLPYAMSQWSSEDQPREKLLLQGEHTLSDSELLAILLRTGSYGQSALDLARIILKKFKSFRKMSRLDISEWKGFKGLGAVKIAQIKAAIEIGRRFTEQDMKQVQPVIECSQNIADLCMPRMRDLTKEVVKVIFLNGQNQILTIAEVEEGTVNAAKPIIREIFKKALERFASAIICVHNHPSGSPDPSPEDRIFTQELFEAGRILGVAVLDHIIIGNNVYYSFSDQEEGREVT